MEASHAIPERGVRIGMKTIIAGINAKYIHTALAARGLAAYAAQRGIDGVRAMEFTINQHPDAILRALYALSLIHIFADEHRHLDPAHRDAPVGQIGGCAAIPPI